MTNYNIKFILKFNSRFFQRGMNSNEERTFQISSYPFARLSGIAAFHKIVIRFYSLNEIYPAGPMIR